MAAHPDVDLVVVSLKVPSHRDPTLAAIAAGKDTFCEWPLGANLGEARAMATAAKDRGVRTMVGLQGRSDPAIMYARELVEKGEIGELLNTHLVVFGPAPTERGPDRAWAAKASAGANTLTIAGGHAIDALAYIAGEFTEVSARVGTRITQWRLSDGSNIDVDAPDSISFTGSLAGGGEVAGTVLSLPSARSETRLLLFGSEGSIAIIPGMNANIGPNVVLLAKGGETPREMPVPDKFKLVPEGTPAGPPTTVAQARRRFADAKIAGQGFEVDFDAAVRRHALLEAMERSSAEGKTIALD